MHAVFYEERQQLLRVTAKCAMPNGTLHGITFLIASSSPFVVDYLLTHFPTSSSTPTYILPGYVQQHIIIIRNRANRCGNFTVITAS